MTEGNRIYLTKEQALEIAHFNESDEIHCYIQTEPLLVGTDHTREDFIVDLSRSQKIEVGGKNSRDMFHALVLWIYGKPYFYEHDEEKLKQMLGE